MKRGWRLCIQLLCLLGGYSPFFLHAQVKYEREYRLNVNKVPDGATAFMANAGFSGKIKWYKEEALDRTSIEAKVRHQGRWYSIEFDDSSTLEDIEILINWEDIPASTRDSIDAYLSENYSKYAFRRIQVQYTGSPEELQKVLEWKTPPSGVTVRYELVAKVQTEKGFGLKEFLFAENGQLEHVATILLRRTDNLEY
ncbi:MAG: hypothetical protein AAGI38_15925 [Bacteroidota bacterium]